MARAATGAGRYTALSDPSVRPWVPQYNVSGCRDTGQWGAAWHSPILSSSPSSCWEGWRRREGWRWCRGCRGWGRSQGRAPPSPSPAPPPPPGSSASGTVPSVASNVPYRKTRYWIWISSGSAWIRQAWGVLNSPVMQRDHEWSWSFEEVDLMQEGVTWRLKYFLVTKFTKLYLFQLQSVSQVSQVGKFGGLKIESLSVNKRMYESLKVWEN